MKARKIKDRIYWMGSVDWDRRLFDSLKGPFYVFSNAAFENLQTERERMEEALEDIGIHFDPSELKT
jgi:hypothetical protein